jgi:hypothetical protein
MTVKFTDLPSLAAVDIADDDVLAVSDISAAASKKVTVADLLSGVVAVELSQVQVENPASTVFGQVSGERLSQAGVVSFTAQEQQIGVGQTWQDVFGSRVVGTSYQNTTGKPIMLAIEMAASASGESLQVSVDNSAWINIGRGSNAGNYYGIVPPSWYYRLASGADIQSWAELR